MKKYLILFCAALAVGFQACNNDNDDLWDAVDDLKNRVQALETQVEALNGNIEAMQALLRDGATISDVRLTDGKYVLTLSNGQVVELVQGHDSEAVIPVVGISDGGEWQVSTDGGATYTSLGVQAAADGAITPRFRVDEATGYWQVSYDGGTTFGNVLDTNDQPVKAVGSGAGQDKFFDAVEVRGDALYVKLLNGPELEVPIVAGFTCKITAPEGVQTFAAGETKQFALTLNGVDQTLVTAPMGWTARIETSGSASSLVVTAPGGTATRAAADSSQDVAILATSGKYACIAKIRVEVDASSVPEPVVDYYTEGVTIDGVTYKVGGTGVELLTIDDATAANVALKPLSSAKVYFLDKQAENSSYDFAIETSASVSADVVVVGRYSNKKPRIVVANSAYWGLKSTTGNTDCKLIFKNVEIDMSARTNYFTNNNNAAASGDHFGLLAFEDCLISDITKPLFAFASNSLAYGIRNIRLLNNKIRIAAAAVQLFNAGASTNLSAYKHIEMRNNVFYGKVAETAYAGQIFNYGNGNAQTGTDWTLAVEITGNTFVNFVGQNVYVKLPTAAKLDISKNIFYAAAGTTNASYLYCLYGNDTSAPVASPDITLDNVFYGGTGIYYDCHANSTVQVGSTHPQAESAPLTLDFVNGSFESTVSGYGATLE